MPTADVPPSGKGPLSLLRSFPRTAWLLLVFGLVATIHGPILRALLGQTLQVAAARQGLVLKTRVDGNVFTECVLENLHLEPKPNAQGPIERLHVEKVSLRYNPLQLLFSATGQGLRAVVIQGADLKLVSGKKNTAAPLPPQKALGKWRETLLNLPLFWSETFHLANINISFGDAETGVLIRGASLSAQPGVDGLLEVESLRMTPGAESLSLRASTSYDNRQFVLKGLKLSPSLTLTRVQLDASKRAEGIALVEVKGLCGEGQLFARIEAGRTQWLLQAEAGRIEAASLKEWIGESAHRLPNLVNARISAGGVPQNADSWTGDLRIECELPMQNTPRASLEFGGTLQKGVFTLSTLKGASPGSSLSGSGKISLPTGPDPLTQMQAEGEIQIESRDLSEWDQRTAPQRMGGVAKGTARLKLSHGSLQTDVSVLGDALTAGAFHAKHCRIDASVSAPARGLGTLENLAGNAVVSVSNPEYAGETMSASLEECAFAATLDSGTARFWNILFKDSANTLAGEVSLPLGSGTLRPSGSLRLKATDLAHSKLRWKGRSFGGTLEATWDASVENGEMLGVGAVSGRGLSWGAFGLDKLRANASIGDGRIRLTEGALEWSGTEWVRAVGTFELSSDDGSVLEAQARLPNLARVSPLLEQLGWAKNRVSGALEGHWKGSGFLGKKSGTGEWSLLIKQAQWEQLKLETFECAGRYVPGLVEVTPLRVITKSTKFSAQLDWKPGALRCTKIALEQWGHPALTGEFILPIAHDAQGFHWVEDTEISGHLRAEKLDLNTLLTVNGTPSPIQGTVQFALNLGGHPADPTANFRCNATGVRPANSPQFGTSSLSIDGRYNQGSLTASATAATPMQAPILLGATLAVPLAELFSGKLSVQDLPFQATLQAKNLILSPLANLLPGLRKTSGSATVDMKLKGTPRNPTWLGELRVDCPLLHFASDRLPAVGGLTLAAEFSEKEIRLSRLKADLGGGNLEIQGTASLATPGEPLLNFKAKAHEVLAVRNAKLALRLNGELSLKGPWKHAEISGAVSPTKSRAQRDIEILPLNVLRMEIPKETRTTGKPWFTFRKAPFSDWRFNVEMRTAKNDPLQIRGNRLRGSAEAEMRLEGTGATPTLHGAYRSTDLIASLPFARIELSRGRIWYTRDHPFQPHIDLSAETEVRNHRIRLYLYGPASAPHITASSEPPEPEADLLNLIATGTLPGDSNERSQTLANRAAAVLFQEFTDKVLPSGDRERFSALRRFSLDLGAINNRSGQQETRLTYRVMDDLFMIGELRPGGDFAARVRYLFRFR